MIDTHCHLTEPRIASQLDKALARAAAAGVRRIVSISVDLDDAEKAVAVCQNRPSLRCAVGVHPTNVSEVAEEELSRLRTLQADPTVVAIGEAGLDYHHSTEHKAAQLRFFEFQLAVAAEVNKPMVIHARDAVADCLAMMRNFPAVRAVFHCFTGTPAEAKQILAAGYLIGFTGAITYPQNAHLEVSGARDVPVDRFVVETDAPWLSPEPMRHQKTNEPAFVMHTARRVAELRGTTSGRDRRADYAHRGSVLRLAGGVASGPSLSGRGDQTPPPGHTSWLVNTPVQADIEMLASIRSSGPGMFSDAAAMPGLELAELLHQQCPRVALEPQQLQRLVQARAASCFMIGVDQPLVDVPCTATSKIVHTAPAFRGRSSRSSSAPSRCSAPLSDRLVRLLEIFRLECDAGPARRSAARRRTASVCSCSGVAVNTRVRRYCWAALRVGLLGT